jgi:hypothetical protein
MQPFKNNVPKKFEIFSPVFCAAYWQYQYVLYILYVYKNMYLLYTI